jgi:hypothetical protein
MPSVKEILAKNDSQQSSYLPVIDITQLVERDKLLVEVMSRYE